MMYKTGKYQAFYIPFIMLRAYWSLPKENESRKTFLLKCSSIRFSGAMVWLGIFLHLIMNILNNTYVGLAKDMALVISFASNQVSPIIFTIYRERWLKLIEDVLDFHVYGKPKGIESKGRSLHLFTIGFQIYATIGLMIYAVKGFLEHSQCKRLNEEKGWHEICGTFLPVWLPFDGDNLTTKVTVAIIQFTTATAVIHLAIIINILTLCVTELIVCHIDHLKLQFNEVFEEEGYAVQFTKFKFCVKYHQHILRLCDDLNYLTKITNGHYSLAGALCLGCIGYQLIQEQSVRCVVHLVGFLLVTFIMCHSGQRLMDKTSSIYESTYSSKWYHSDKKMMKDVRFVIARSQKLTGLTALPFGYFNYPLFVMIAKTAYSYLTLLNDTT